ncbi:MAG: preprotein translocase subunit SecG [Flavobacteriaceae bacterium]|nr:preprotein translocase subunit SecG [Flavobacteriaceae bacterium]
MNTFTIFLILIILVAFLLVVVIMVQNPKGGGLSSSFGGGGGQQLGGVKKTTDFLDKSTWALATLLLALILASNLSIPGAGGDIESKALDQTENNDSRQEVPLEQNTPLPTTQDSSTDTIN